MLYFVNHFSLHVSCVDLSSNSMHRQMACYILLLFRFARSPLIVIIFCFRYITYSKEEEAVRCIQSVHGFTLDGRPLKYEHFIYVALNKE